MRAFKYIAIVLLSGLASCDITKHYQQPKVATDKLFRDTTITDTTSIATLKWKTLFSDPALQTLIQEGLDQNLDLKTAIARINEAQATLRQRKAEFYPSLEGYIQANPVHQSAAALNFPSSININLNTTTYQAGLSTSWEADIWGKMRSAKRSALAAMLKTEASARAVKTQLIANIANTYYQLLALDQQLIITEQTLKKRQEDVETMRALKDNGTVNATAVVQSEANFYAAEVSIPDLKQTIRETENALCILLAKSPGPVQRASLNDQQGLTGIAVGIPAHLLHNRPDVQAAELNFRAAFETTNLARTYFYPALTITGSGGLSSLKLENFFISSLFYNVVGGLTQPIFQKGANNARLRTAKAQQEQALFGFEQSLLVAGQEVSNALYSHQNALIKQETRKKQIGALEKSVEYTKELLQFSSSTNYTDVLTSEQSLLAAQLSSINDRLQELQSIVNLYQALGGGSN